MHILGLDLGTVCGVADGPPGDAKFRHPEEGKPQPKHRVWTINLEQEAGHGQAAKLAYWQVWLESYFAGLRRFRELDKSMPSVCVFYEQPLTLGALIQMTNSKKGLQTNDAQLDFARGQVGILKATAFNAGVRIIEAVNMHEARRALTKDYNADKNKVKVYCDMLDWDSANDNESDCLCIWNYGAAKSNPRLAHLSTPLFGSR